MKVKVVGDVNGKDFSIDVDDKTSASSKKIVVFRIGDKDRPATEEDIRNFAKTLSIALKDPNPIIVTHHAVSWDFIYINGNSDN